MTRWAGAGVVLMAAVLVTTGCSAGTASSASVSSKHSSAPVASASAVPSAAAAVCMVGSWRASNVAITAGSGTLNGGAGATWTIDAQGDETVDWAGSAPFTESGATLFHYLGTETEQVTLPSGAAASGTWSAKVLTDSRQSVGPTGTTTVPSTAGVTSTGTWTCSGDAFTIDAGASGSSIVVTLARAA